MCPEPFLRLGPLAVTGYGLMLALAALAALLLIGYTAPRRQLPVGRVRDLCFWLLLTGIFGARFFYVVFHWPEFAASPSGILAYWRGGLMFQGGLFTALVAALFFLKRYRLPLWSTADVLGPCLALGQALGRVGCFLVGCCYGRPGQADSWGLVRFPAHSLAPSDADLYPVQLYESAGLLILTLVLLKALSAKIPGRAASLYLLGAGLLRFAMEHFRGDFRGREIIWGLPPTTLTALVTILAGLLIFLLKKPKKF